MDGDCCDLLSAGHLQLPAALLVGSLLSAALLVAVSRHRRRYRRPDQCRSLDCTRCWAGAAASRRATARLSGAGAGACTYRLQAALLNWSGQPDAGLLVPDLSERAWWHGHLPAATTADVELLEQAWPRVLAEYQAALRTPHHWTVNESPAGRWRVFWLVNQGVRVRSDCPDTCHVLDSLQTLMRHTIFSNVCFSVLEPGTCIEPHRGPTNTRIRCHLGLEVPTDSQLVVDGRSRRWTDGRCLLFDDSYLHWAENAGGAGGTARAVLMLDLWHPRLAPQERQTLAHVLHIPAPHSS